jgi:hypothetical protein
MTNASVPYEEIYRAAAHEVGHAMISAEVGVHVYYVGIHRDGSGLAESEVPRSPIADLKLTFGGYIAEAMAEGEVPTFKGMTMLASNEDDLMDVGRILQDKRMKPEIALPKAFEAVVKFFSMPANFYRMTRLAKKLAKTRYLDGHYFNPRKVIPDAEGV